MEARFTTTGMQFIPWRPKYCKGILNSRSVWAPGTHTSTPIAAHVMKDINGKRLLTYACGKTWLEQNIPEFEITNMPPNTKYKVEADFRLNVDVVPSDIQASAINAVFENSFKTAFFNVPTGAGKTLISVYLMSLLKTKGWAMCYRTNVLEQWKDTLENMTDFNMERVKIVKSSKELLKMASGDWDPHDYDIYLSTPILLVKFAETHGMDLLNDVMDTCGIGVKFFDEAHRNVGNICKINALTNIERTYYLSADFGQASPDREYIYFKMFGKVPVIKPKEEKVQELKYTTGVVTRYNTHPSFNDVESVFTKFGFNHYRYMEYQITRPNFYDAFDRVLMQLNAPNPYNDDKPYRTIILCNLIKHVDQLREYVAQKVSEFQWDYTPTVTGYHSQMEDDVKHEALKGEIIVSTYQSMGVGVDLKGIRYVLSLAPVNVIDDNQAAGRARALPHGEECFYFMFIDDGFEYVKKRLPARLDYLYQQKLRNIVSIKYT